MELREALRAESNRKKAQIFKTSFAMQEKTVRVHVQHVSGSDMLRLRAATEIGDDIVADAVAPQSIAETFAGCNEKYRAQGVGGHDDDVVNLSIDRVLEQMEEDRKAGRHTRAASQASFFLAWQIDGHRTSKGKFVYDAPELVGIATAYRMSASERFDTHRQAFHEDHADRIVSVLRPFVAGAGAGHPPGTKSAYLWLDAVCSDRDGVGKLLVNAVHLHVLKQKLKGIVCVAFSKKRSAVPEAVPLLEAVGFAKTAELRYRQKGKHGTLMVLKTTPFNISGISDEALEICMRKAYNGKGITPRCAQL